MNSGRLLFGGLEGANYVKKSKTYFEQIPVEVVKKIVQELPEKIEEMGNDKGSPETPNGNSEPASPTGGFVCRKGV